jgi:stage II sporulation protein D
MIATYQGEPINALYTSTCGGRTEDAENIFPNAVPYLRGRECAAEGKAAFAPFMIKSSREPFEIKDEKDLAFARDVALLSANGFVLPVEKVSSSWLSAHVSERSARMAERLSCSRARFLISGLTMRPKRRHSARRWSWRFLATTAPTPY